MDRAAFQARFEGRFADPRFDGERAAIDFVIRNDETVAFFQGRQQADYGHGIKLWQGAEQCCIRPEAACSAAQAKYIVQQTQNICFQRHAFFSQK